MAARGPHSYFNVRSRNLKYKGKAKENRKEKRRSKGIVNPKDSGEDIPPFFLPARQKLYFSLLTDVHNCKRFGRKPIPEEEKKAFAEKAKAYAEYKLAEKKFMDDEEAIVTNA